MRLFDRQGRERERTLRVDQPARSERPGDAAERHRRPPAGAVHRARRHRRHAFLVWERARRRRRALPVPAGARTRPPHRRIRASGELRRHRLQLRGHRRPRARRLHLRARRRPRHVDRPRAARIRRVMLESRAKRGRRPYPRVVSTRSQGQLRGRARRDLRPPQRAREGIPRAAAGAVTVDLDRARRRDDQRTRSHAHRADRDLACATTRASKRAISAGANWSAARSDGARPRRDPAIAGALRRSTAACIIARRVRCWRRSRRSRASTTTSPPGFESPTRSIRTTSGSARNSKAPAR